MKGEIPYPQSPVSKHQHLLGSGEATSPANPPPPGLAHFCTPVHGSTDLNLVFWEPQAQFERAEGEEALLGAAAARKGYT